MSTTMKLIGKQTLTGNTASVTFSNIPGTMTDLLLTYSARSTKTSAFAEGVKARFNGAASDTSHSARYLYAGEGSPASGTDSFARAGFTTAVDATSSTFSNCEVYIPNYAGSTNKSFSVTAVTESNSTTSGAALILVAASLWSSTAAITSIELIPTLGGSFISDSTFFLYGISKA